MSYQEVSVVRLIRVISFFLVDKIQGNKCRNGKTTDCNSSDQIIATSHGRKPQKVAEEPKSPYFRKSKLVKYYTLARFMRYSRCDEIHHLGKNQTLFPYQLGGDLEPQNLPKQRAVKVPRKFPSSGQWNVGLVAIAMAGYFAIHLAQRWRRWMG